MRIIHESARIITIEISPDIDQSEFDGEFDNKVNVLISTDSDEKISVNYESQLMSGDSNSSVYEKENVQFREECSKSESIVRCETKSKTKQLSDF